MCVAAEIIRPQISSPNFSVAADHNTSSIPFFIVLSGHPSKAAGPPQVPGMQCRSHSACWQFWQYSEPLVFAVQFRPKLGALLAQEAFSNWGSEFLNDSLPLCLCCHSLFYQHKTCSASLGYVLFVHKACFLCVAVQMTALAPENNLFCNNTTAGSQTFRDSYYQNVKVD